VKLFGIGLALAVLVDAFLIRATLLPAFMQLAGRANWWAPRPLRRWHLRWGLWEAEPVSILDDTVPTGERG
jgi:RND superfamily putative drug exporter